MHTLYSYRIIRHNLEFIQETVIIGYLGMVGLVGDTWGKKKILRFSSYMAVWF